MSALREERQAAVDTPAAQSVAALYERYRDDVFTYCQRRLRNREEAEDATQVTFLKALTGLRNGAVPLVENAWLFTIAKRVVLTRLEVTNRLLAIEAKAEIDAVAENRGDALERAEMDELWKAVEALPETARRAFLMREWQGMQYEEIADALGLDKGHVGVMLLRARRRVVATVQTGRGRVRALLNISSLSGVVRRVADLFSGNASNLLLAATTIASPVGVLGMPGAHPTGIAQRVLSANAVAVIARDGAAPARTLASLEAPRPFIVLQTSVTPPRGVSPTVDEPSGPDGPGTWPGAPVVPSSPGGGVEPDGGTRTPATASGGAEVLPAAGAGSDPVPILVLVPGTETNTDAPESPVGSRGKSGSKPASLPGRSAGATHGPPAKEPPTTNAHGGARAFAAAAAAAGVAKNGSKAAQDLEKPRGPSTEHGAQRGQAGRNSDPLAAPALRDGVGNNGNGVGSTGNNGVGNNAIGNGNNGVGTNRNGLGHGKGVGPSEAAHEAGPILPGKAADALPAVPADWSQAPPNTAASSGPNSRSGENTRDDRSVLDSPSTTQPRDLSNGPVAANPAPGNGHGSSGQGHAADAVVAEVLVVATVPVELGVQDAPADPAGAPFVATDPAPANGHGTSGKGNGADAAVAVETVPVAVPAAAAPAQVATATSGAPAKVTAPARPPAASTPAAPPATSDAPGKKPPQK